MTVSQEKIQTLADFWPLVGPIYEGPVDDPQAREKWLDDEHRALLAEVDEALAEVDPWDAAHIEPPLQDLIQRRGAKPKDVFQPIRVALVGRTVSPGIFETLELVGKEESRSRIRRALTMDSMRPRLRPSTWLARRSTEMIRATSDSTAATISAVETRSAPTTRRRRLRDSARAGNDSSASKAAVRRRPWPSL